jgi:hypothetical protein
MAIPLHPLSNRRGIARPHPGDDHCRHGGRQPDAQGAARLIARFPLLKAEATGAGTYEEKSPRSEDLCLLGAE